MHLIACLRIESFHTPMKDKKTEGKIWHVSQKAHEIPHLDCSSVLDDLTQASNASQFIYCSSLMWSYVFPKLQFFNTIQNHPFTWVHSRLMRFIEKIPRMRNKYITFVTLRLTIWIPFPNNMGPHYVNNIIILYILKESKQNTHGLTPCLDINYFN